MSVFILLSLYQVIKFYESSQTINLLLFGISAGLMIGMKYTLLLNLMMFSVLLLPKLRRVPLSALLYLVITILLCGGYWYIRNYIVFGNPVYPLLGPDAKMLQLSQTTGLLNQLYDLVIKIKLLFTKDNGIGSFHGGFGLYFWSVAIPAWIYLLVRSLKTKIDDRTSEILIWSQLFIGLAILIMMPYERLRFQARYLLFIIAIGCLAVGTIISQLNTGRIGWR